MKLIPLTQGQYAKVDDADYHWLSQWKWTAQKTETGFYAMRKEAGSVVYMHRLINGTEKGLLTDHRDGDGLNNCRANLRDATPLQNMMNQRPARGGTSRLKGAWYDQHCHNRNKWRSAIRVNGKLKYLGRFATEQEAARAYANAAEEYFGQFAHHSGGAA